MIVVNEKKDYYYDMYSARSFNMTCIEQEIQDSKEDEFTLDESWTRDFYGRAPSFIHEDEYMYYTHSPCHRRHSNDLMMKSLGFKALNFCHTSIDNHMSVAFLDAPILSQKNGSKRIVLSAHLVASFIRPLLKDYSIRERIGRWVETSNLYVRSFMSVRVDYTLIKRGDSLLIRNTDFVILGAHADIYNQLEDRVDKTLTDSLNCSIDYKYNLRRLAAFDMCFSPIIDDLTKSLYVTADDYVIVGLPLKRVLIDTMLSNEPEVVRYDPALLKDGTSSPVAHCAEYKRIPLDDVLAHIEDD